MKQLTMLVTAFLLSVSTSYAVSIGTIVKDIRKNTRFSALEGISPGFVYSAKKGGSGAAQGGVVNHFFTYRNLITADVGWSNALNGHETGTVFGGPGLQVDTALKLIFPEYAQALDNLVSPLVKKVLDAQFATIYGGWRTSNGAFDYGYVLGINTKF